MSAAQATARESRLAKSSRDMQLLKFNCASARRLGCCRERARRSVRDIRTTRPHPTGALSAIWLRAVLWRQILYRERVGVLWPISACPFLQCWLACCVFAVRCAFLVSWVGSAVTYTLRRSPRVSRPMCVVHSDLSPPPPPASAQDTTTPPALSRVRFFLNFD